MFGGLQLTTRLVVTWGLALLVVFASSYVCMEMFHGLNREVSERHDVNALDDFAAHLRHLASTSTAVFTPTLDVHGAANCTGQTPSGAVNPWCHEVDFYIRDASQGAHWQAFTYQNGGVQEYTYSDPQMYKNAAPLNVVAVGEPLALNYFQVRAIPITSYGSDPGANPIALAIYQQQGLGSVVSRHVIQTAFAGVTISNDLYHVEMGNPYWSTSADLLVGAEPSVGVMVDAGTSTPTPPPPPDPTNNSLVFPYPGALVSLPGVDGDTSSNGTATVTEADYHDFYTLSVANTCNSFVSYPNPQADIGSPYSGTYSAGHPAPPTPVPGSTYVYVNPNNDANQTGTGTFNALTPGGTSGGVCGSSAHDVYGQGVGVTTNVMGPFTIAPDIMLQSTSFPSSFDNAAIASKNYDDDPAGLGVGFPGGTSCSSTENNATAQDGAGTIATLAQGSYALISPAGMFGLSQRGVAVTADGVGECQITLGSAYAPSVDAATTDVEVRGIEDIYGCPDIDADASQVNSPLCSNGRGTIYVCEDTSNDCGKDADGNAISNYGTVTVTFPGYTGYVPLNVVDRSTGNHNCTSVELYAPSGIYNYGGATNLNGYDLAYLSSQSMSGGSVTFHVNGRSGHSNTAGCNIEIDSSGPPYGWPHVMGPTDSLGTLLNADINADAPHYVEIVTLPKVAPSTSPSPPPTPGPGPVEVWPAGEAYPLQNDAWSPCGTNQPQAWLVDGSGNFSKAMSNAALPARFSGAMSTDGNGCAYASMTHGGTVLNQLGYPSEYVSEQNGSGNFSVPVSSCNNIASVKINSGSAPTGNLVVYGEKLGTCSYEVQDASSGNISSGVQVAVGAGTCGAVCYMELTGTYGNYHVNCRYQTNCPPTSPLEVLAVGLMYVSHDAGQTWQLYASEMQPTQYSCVWQPSISGVTPTWTEYFSFDPSNDSGAGSWVFGSINPSPGPPSLIRGAGTSCSIVLNP